MPGTVTVSPGCPNLRALSFSAFALAKLPGTDVTSSSFQPSKYSEQPDLPQQWGSRSAIDTNVFFEANLKQIGNLSGGRLGMVIDFMRRLFIFAIFLPRHSPLPHYSFCPILHGLWVPQNEGEGK